MRVMFQAHLEGKCAFSKHIADFQYIINFLFSSQFFEVIPKTIPVITKTRICLQDTHSIGVFGIQTKNARFTLESRETSKDAFK